MTKKNAENAECVKIKKGSTGGFATRFSASPKIIYLVSSALRSVVIAAKIQMIV